MEIWFDGGYSGPLKDRLRSLIQKYQPNASALGGFGLTNNSIRNINNEFGYAPHDTWLTVNANGDEDPGGRYFSFPECTTTLQVTDRWFYGDNAFALRPLNELIDAYHATVGHNCKLLLDLAVDQNGVVDPRHATKYRQLGDFIRGCYGKPLPSNFTCTDNYCVLQFTTTQLVDRVLIREDLRSPSGATIRQFSMDVFTIWGDGQSWYGVPSGTGRSVGYKRIILIGEAIFISAVRINIYQTSGAKPTLAQFDAFLCQND